MSDYDIRPGGSLKLKGGASDGGTVKRKNKKGKAAKNELEREQEKEHVKEMLRRQDPDSKESPSGSGRQSPAAASSSSAASRKTEAQKRFEEVQKKRLERKVLKLAHKTHKDRVSEFNAHLETLSEHHDIPKVGPG